MEKELNIKGTILRPIEGEEVIVRPTDQELRWAGVSQVRIDRMRKASEELYKQLNKW